jgi:hypothetical protein
MHLCRSELMPPSNVRAALEIACTPRSGVP